MLKIHIPPVTITADSILGHQLDQLAPVKMGINVMVEEDILGLGYKEH